LADLRADRRKTDDTVERGISAQTFNFYLQAVKQFCRWMVRDGRASESPLVHLQGLNVKTDRRHDRRALSPDEMRWLLDVTAKAPERYGMTGEARAMLYRLAVETGLRAAELRSLTRGSFDLGGDEPSVTIAAAYAKNRRQDTLPLEAHGALLAKHFTGKMPQAKAFAVPHRTAWYPNVRADMAEAREAWMDANGRAESRPSGSNQLSLSIRDESGRWVDFHALSTQNAQSGDRR
jgi:integrase